MLAKEGTREMLIATVVLGAAAWGLNYLHWAAAMLPVVVWIWVISFFRDPRREGTFAEKEMCAPADGKVTEISRLEHHEDIGGPAIRIGIFLSIFNVHANRAPCNGTVKSVHYKPGKFLDARDPDSGVLNESNTVVMEAEAPFAGTVVVQANIGF